MSGLKDGWYWVKSGNCSHVSVSRRIHISITVSSMVLWKPSVDVRLNHICATYTFCSTLKSYRSPTLPIYRRISAAMSSTCWLGEDWPGRGLTRLSCDSDSASLKYGSSMSLLSGAALSDGCCGRSHCGTNLLFLNRFRTYLR